MTRLFQLPTNFIENQIRKIKKIYEYIQKSLKRKAV